jgi:membrane protein
VPGFGRGLRGAWEYVREVYDQAASDNIFFLAGGLTFSLLLAAIPFLILILSLAGIALAPRIDAPENAVMEWLATLMPVNPATEAQLREQLSDIVESSRSVGIISGVLFVWFSTRLFGSLRTVLEAVFDLREGPGIIRGKILDVKMVVIASLLLTANIGITTTMTAVGREIIEQLGLPTAQALQALGYGTAYGAIFLMFLLIYKFVPTTRLSWRIATVAALFSAVGFELLKSALGWYLAEVADFSQVFFAFATLIVLVVSLYYAAVIFVLGGEVAKVYGQRSVMRRQRVMFDQA